jgi:hypothetical protein
MNKLKYMAGVAIAAMAISSCTENTEMIGNSMTSESDKLDVSSSVFHATTRTILADSVLTKSSYTYLGRVIDPETQTEVKSDFTTQFYVLKNLYISGNYVKTEDGEIVADSCELVIYLSSPFSTEDKLNALQLNVRELDKPAPETMRYYSNYDHTPLLRTDANAINVSHVFSYENMTDNDASRAGTYYLNNIRIPLNQPYTSMEGDTYKNYGTYILQALVDYKNEHNRNPNSYVFAHDICPGFAFEITDGLGFHSAISNIGLRVYYYVNLPDTSYKASFSLAGTEEVMQTIKITNDKAALKSMAEPTNVDYTYLKTPAGLFTEMTFPIDDIWKGHENDSLLATKMTLQRLHNTQADSRTFGTPKTLLMVQKDSLYSYFENKKLPDSRSSFISSYNSNYNVYTFSNISNLISRIWRIKQEGIAAIQKSNPGMSWDQAKTTWENETDGKGGLKHKDWNKVVLVPISYGTSSTSTIPIWVAHDLSLSSTRLVGGTTPIEMNVVYAKFKK